LLKAEDDNFVGGRRGDAAVDPNIVRRKAWELGKSPLGSVITTLLLMYFAGSTLSIMSLMMCGMMILSPIRSLMALEATFRPFDELLRGDPAVFRSKCVFVSIHLFVLLAALYKFAQLGVLPVTAADYIRSVLVPAEDPHVGWVIERTP